MKLLRSLLLVLVLCSASHAERLSYDLLPRPMGSVSQRVGIVDVIYNLFKQAKQEQKANRLLVITEPGWCDPCRQLDPVLKKLKKEGYDIYEYSQRQWSVAKPKPANVPATVQKEGNRPRVPTLLFVQADAKVNKVIRWKRGWSKDDSEENIKRYLTK